MIENVVNVIMIIAGIIALAGLVYLHIEDRKGIEQDSGKKGEG